MSLTSGSGFRRLPLRVALISTAIVAVLYVVAAVAVLAILRNNLVASIDARLTQQLGVIQARPDAIAEAFGGDGTDLDNDGDARRFDAPLVVWVRGQAGETYQSDANAPLPEQLEAVPGPATATIGGAEMRLVGGPLAASSGQGWVTIAQSLGEVTSAINTLIVAELLIAPGLLVLVFGGALLVGRRVAGPIEHARLAQLAFTADASHELRTPLTVIEAEASLGLQADREPAAYRQTLTRIKDETQQLRRLVDDLLWLARFESTPSTPSPEAVDVGVLADAAAERFTPIGNQRGTTITASVTGRANPVINAAPEWIARLISVLVDNAVRHTPAGTTVAVKVEAEGNRVQVAVEDDGPGIPADQRDQVLDRFHRASDAHEGAGLGLAIADAIVSATGGHWEIGESNTGGARMAVSWPRASSRAFDGPTAQEATREADAETLSPGPEAARSQNS